MRILFVTSVYPTEAAPGESPCIGQQREALQRLGHEVDLLHFRTQESKLTYFKEMGRVFWGSQVLGKYDIVHAHYGYCGVVARAELRCPVVVTYRGSDVLDRSQRPISRLLSRLVDCNIVMTEEMKQVLGRGDAHVIPYGVDLETFFPRPLLDARMDLGLPQEAPLVLFPYDPRRQEKRFDLVEQACAMVRPTFPSLRLVTIHDQPPHVVAAHMSACDAMVLASDHEGAPMAVREAMACGLPIISVDVGDVADLIRHTEGCHIVERSPESIARKLADVLASRRRTAGRQVVTGMSTETAAVRLSAIYGKLLRKKRRPGYEWA